MRTYDRKIGYIYFMSGPVGFVCVCVCVVCVLCVCSFVCSLLKRWLACYSP
jgi:hypothetical protein